jgi:ketosteroid isomerase-like protein
MKKLIFSFSLLSFLFACSTKIDSEKSKQEMLRTDRTMSAEATLHGFYSAILEFADDSIVKLDDGNYPVIGKKSLTEYYGDKKGPTTIMWNPVNAEIAQSGELGYTWGNWKYVAKDSTYFGNYFTAWKKDANGNWKVMLDGGNDTPAPKGN